MIFYWGNAMSKKGIICRNVVICGIIILIIVVYVGSIIEKNNEGKRQFESMNKYLQQEADLQIKRIPEWYSASLSMYNVKEINTPIYWLESSGEEQLQNSCYYFQFHTSMEALKIWKKIEKKDDFILINSGIFYVADVGGDIEKALSSVKSVFTN